MCNTHSAAECILAPDCNRADHLKDVICAKEDTDTALELTVNASYCGIECNSMFIAFGSCRVSDTTTCRCLHGYYNRAIRMCNRDRTFDMHCRMPGATRCEFEHACSTPGRNINGYIMRRYGVCRTFFIVRPNLNRRRCCGCGTAQCAMVFDMCAFNGCTTRCFSVGIRLVERKIMGTRDVRLCPFDYDVVLPNWFCGEVTAGDSRGIDCGKGARRHNR